MPSFVSKAASISPPVRGVNLKVIEGADVAASTAIAIPDSWKGACVTFKADGDKFFIAFGTTAAATSVVKDAKSNIASNAFTTDEAGICEVIADSDKLEVDLQQLDKRYKYFAVLADTGAGFLRITRSSGPVTP